MANTCQAALVILISTAAACGPAFAGSIPVTEFGQLALHCGPTVAPSTLASIAQIESGFDPLSVNDNTTGISGIPATRDIAIQIVSKLLEAGHSVDIGVMQINSANFAKLGLTVETALDPCKSIAAGAAVLTGDYAGGDSHDQQQSALRIAISKYNTGNAQRGVSNGYVHKVELAAGQIVPALDVAAAPVGTASQPVQAAVATAPIDPNAPPSWDVWSSYEYIANHPESTLVPASSRPALGAAVVATAEAGPTSTNTASAPVVER